MKFLIHIAFSIPAFHHQNLTRYHVHLVRHLNCFFMKTTFEGSAAEPQQAIN